MNWQVRLSTVQAQAQRQRVLQCLKRAPVSFYMGVILTSPPSPCLSTMLFASLEMKEVFGFFADKESEKMPTDELPTIMRVRGVGYDCCASMISGVLVVEFTATALYGHRGDQSQSGLGISRGITACSSDLHCSEKSIPLSLVKSKKNELQVAHPPHSLFHSTSRRLSHLPSAL